VLWFGVPDPKRHRARLPSPRFGKPRRGLAGFPSEGDELKGNLVFARPKIPLVPVSVQTCPSAPSAVVDELFARETLRWERLSLPRGRRRALRPARRRETKLETSQGSLPLWSNADSSPDDSSGPVGGFLNRPGPGGWTLIEINARLTRRFQRGDELEPTRAGPRIKGPQTVVGPLPRNGNGRFGRSAGGSYDVGAGANGFCRRFRRRVDPGWPLNFKGGVRSLRGRGTEFDGGPYFGLRQCRGGAAALV